jgi:multiple antibiotic resistance protein
MIGPTEIFTFFFVTLGPLKLIGPFAQRTHGIDDAAARRIAWWTFVVATLGIVAGALLGRALLENWHISLPALTLTGGIVFFLVAIRHLLEQYEPPVAIAPQPLPASPLAAAGRIVFPMVLTPYGIAAAIALLAQSGDATRTTMILGLLLAVMVLNLIAMWFARRILVGFAVLILQVLGAVLAVLQVALSVQLILRGLRLLNAIT